MNVQDTDRLIELAGTGDHSARCRLLERHRERLRRLVAAFLDPRVSARIDPSDVLQNALARASLKLPQYLAARPIAFYPWLKQIVMEELVNANRRHVDAQCRSVRREQRHHHFLSDASAMELADRLVSREPSPSTGANQRELLEKVQAGMSQMSDNERDLLSMRFIEQLNVREIAEVLGIQETAASSRVRRALEKLSDLVTKGSI